MPEKPQDILPIKSNNIKKIPTHFDDDGFLKAKNQEILNYGLVLKKELSEVKDDVNEGYIFDQIGFPDKGKKIKKFIEKEGVDINDLLKFKDLFLYLKSCCGEWFNYSYIANQQNPSQYIIKNTIELINSIKLNKYDYNLVKNILSNKDINFINLFGNNKVVSFLGWFDVLDFMKDEYIISINNCIKKNKLIMDLGNNQIIYPFDFNFNLINFIAKYLKSKNIQISDDNIANGINELSLNLKENFQKKYDAVIFFSVDQYDSGNQFKSDRWLFQNVKQDLKGGDVIDILCPYEFAKTKITDSLNDLKNKGKNNILVYISCHGGANGDSYFNDYSGIGKIQKIFSKSDLEEISKLNFSGVCDYDKCYGAMNSGDNVNIICGNYIGNIGSKSRLIKSIEQDKYTYNKAKFFQMFNANTIIYPASLIRDLNRK